LFTAESRIPSHVVWTEPELITAHCQWAAAAHEIVREAYESAAEAEQRMQPIGEHGGRAQTTHVVKNGVSLDRWNRME
jgi:hypothetical protein